MEFPWVVLASNAYPALFILFNLALATLTMSCQGPHGIWTHLDWTPLLWTGVEQQPKASAYLQTRDWTVRMTSKGLGCFPSWTTKFLYVQIDLKVVKIPCRYFILSWSKFLCLKRICPSHCCTEIFLRSDVWTARGVSCQTALAKVQKIIKWGRFLILSTQGEELSTWIPLVFKVRKVGKLSWQSLHTKDEEDFPSFAC